MSLVLMTFLFKQRSWRSKNFLLRTSNNEDQKNEDYAFGKNTKQPSSQSDDNTKDMLLDKKSNRNDSVETQK